MFKILKKKKNTNFEFEGKMADVQSENLFLFNKKKLNKKASKSQFFLCKDKGGRV